jgi:DNA-binding transcriptional ArsR family regulator
LTGLSLVNDSSTSRQNYLGNTSSIILPDYLANILPIISPNYLAMCGFILPFGGICVIVGKRRFNGRRCKCKRITGWSSSVSLTTALNGRRNCFQNGSKSQRTISRELREYQDAGLIHREGARKNGKWVVD